MARRTKHDAQVDPFNAGEPTLPWDESPSPFGEGDQTAEECEFGDKPYDSPTKRRDNYQAPEADAPQPPSGGDSTARQRKKAARAKVKSEKRTAMATPQATPVAHKRLRTTIGVFIAVIALGYILPLFTNLASGVVEDVTSAYNAFTNTDPDYPGTPDDEDGSILTADPDVEEEQAKKECEDAVDEHIARMLAENSMQRTEFATMLSEMYEANTEFTADELGIDARGFANWLLDNFTYEIDSCFVFDDGTANLYFATWAPNATDVMLNANTDIYDYLSDEGAYDVDDYTLSSAQKERVRKMHAVAMSKTPLDSEFFASVTLELKNGIWVVDGDSIEDEVATALGIW